MRLVAEDRDLEVVRVLQNLLDAGDARHAVADHHQLLLHALCSAERFDPHRALLVIRLARDGIEGALRHLVHVGFREMERHEHLAGRDDLGEPQFDAAHAAAARDDVHRIVAAQPEHLRIARIHLEPGARRQPLQNRHLARLRARVPVLDGAAGVEDERIARRWAAPGTAPSPRRSAWRGRRRLEFAVGVEARRAVRSRALGQRPLHRAVLGQQARS